MVEFHQSGLSKIWTNKRSPLCLTRKLERSVSGALQGPGVLQALHDDEEVGVDVQHEVPGSLGGPGPVVVTTTAPDWTVAVGSPSVRQLHSR